MKPENVRSGNAEMARLFLRLGITGFGGPAVHMAMMEEAVVRRRGWLDHRQFLDLVGAANLVPGPNSTELAMHIGAVRGGRRGLFVAGACFILPAVLITAAMAWAYARWGQLPAVQPFIYGIQPAVIAVVGATAIRLAGKAVKGPGLAALALLCFAAVWMGMHEIFVLFGAGAAGMALGAARGKLTGIAPFLLQAVAPLPAAKLFWVFLKVGALLYGSGYVLFGFLDAELVGRGWMTKQQLTDAIAAGQVTPGPVFSSATFIGWQLGGPAGAAAATTGIFLPSFLFILLLNPLLPRLQRSRLMRAFLDAVNVASVAIILSLVVEMARASIGDWRTLLIAAGGAACSLAWPRINTVWIILGGALGGYCLALL